MYYQDISEVLMMQAKKSKKPETVILRKSGNSRVLSVPKGVSATLGTKYEMKVLPNNAIIYTPVKRQNIFSKPEWQNHDFSKDLQDPELGEVKSVGKEKL